MALSEERTPIQTHSPIFEKFNLLFLGSQSSYPQSSSTTKCGTNPPVFTMVGTTIRSPPAASRSTCLGLLVADPSSQPPFETPISSAVRDSGTLLLSCNIFVFFGTFLMGKAMMKRGKVYPNLRFMLKEMLPCYRE